MTIHFDANIANALVQGQPIPVPWVHKFCQDAYDTFVQAKKLENELESLRDDLKRVEGQRNDSNRKIEELQDQLFNLNKEDTND